MTITADNPHRREGRSYGVSFWKGNTASNEKEASRAVVYTGPAGMPYPEFSFDLPAQRHEMAKLETALIKAFDRGVFAAKKQIRDVLDIPEQR